MTYLKATAKHHVFVIGVLQHICLLLAATANNGRPKSGVQPRPNPTHQGGGRSSQKTGPTGEKRGLEKGGESHSVFCF